MLALLYAYPAVPSGVSIAVHLLANFVELARFRLCVSVRIFICELTDIATGARATITQPVDPGTHAYAAQRSIRRILRQQTAASTEIQVRIQSTVTTAYISAAVSAAVRDAYPFIGKSIPSADPISARISVTVHNRKLLDIAVCKFCWCCSWRKFIVFAVAYLAFDIWIYLIKFIWFIENLFELNLLNYLIFRYCWISS